MSGNSRLQVAYLSVALRLRLRNAVGVSTNIAPIADCRDCPTSRPFHAHHSDLRFREICNEAHMIEIGAQSGMAAFAKVNDPSQHGELPPSANDGRP